MIHLVGKRFLAVVPAKTVTVGANDARILPSIMEVMTHTDASSNFGSTNLRPQPRAFFLHTRYWLVVTGTWILFSILLGIITPIDFHIFQRG